MNRRIGVAAVLAGLAAAALAWRLLPVTAPPIYDGVCTADPYRLLGHDPAPQSASKTYPPSPDFRTDQLFTGQSDAQPETPPQAQLIMTDGTFIAPASALTISITAVQQPAQAPQGFAFAGNVYRIAAVTASGTHVPPRPNHPLTISLRATSSNPSPTMFRSDGTAWTQLKTISTGCGDTFEAVSPQTGYFVLAAPVSASDGGALPQGGGAPVVPIVIALAAAILVAVAGLVYLNGTRRR